MTILHSMQELLDLIEDYKANHEYEMSALENYVPAMPMVSSKKIAVFRALLSLLKSKNTGNVMGALESSKDLSDGLQYNRSFVGTNHNLVINFDETRLDMIVALYEEQHNKPTSELLQETRQQQELIDDLFKIVRRSLLLYGQTCLTSTKVFNSRSSRRQSQTNADFVMRKLLGLTSDFDLNPKVAANQMNHTVLVDVFNKYAREVVLQKDDIVR